MSTGMVDADRDAVRAVRIQHVDVRTPLPGSSWCSNWFSSRTGICARSKALLRRQVRLHRYTFHTYISSGIGSNILAFLTPGSLGQRAKLRRDRHVVVGLGHDRRLAGEGIAHQRQLVAGADQEGVEAVQLFEALLHRRFQIVALAHAPLEKAAGRFGVVVGLERDAEMLQLAPDHVRVGEGAVVHQAEVLAGRERMRAIGRDRRFGRHARVPDHVRAARAVSKS